MKKFIFFGIFFIVVLCILLSKSLQVFSFNYFGNDNNLSNIDSVEVTELYALGTIPSPFGCPDTLGIRLKKNFPGAYDIFLKIRVQNIDTPFVLKDSVFYTISNPNTFDTLIFHPLTCLTLSDVNEIRLATNRIIVEALPGKSLQDFYSAKEYCQYSTCNVYNYADPCLTDHGGTGLDGRTGNLVARFNNYSSSVFPVYAVDHSFFNANGQGSQPYKIVIYTDNGSGKPGTLVYSSSTLMSPSGTGAPQSVTHKLATPVNISGNSRFYVGIRQVSTTNIKMSYQNETPVRSKIFFFSSPDTSTVWKDFSDSSKNLRLDISPRTSANVSIKAYLEGFFNGTSMIPDTAGVILRKLNSPYVIIDSAKSVLDATGFGVFRFLNVSSDSNYYFAVKHRNHIETWSKFSQQINECSKFYNYTDSISKAYGNNMTSVAGKFVFYGGDVNQDGSVDGQDISQVDNDAFNFVSGYVNTDINGDNLTDVLDLVLADNNAFNFVGIITPP